MLTADLVSARRRGTELFVNELGSDRRARAVDLAEQLIHLFRKSTGLTRDEVEAALCAIEVDTRQQRLKEGFVKLLEDRATWESTRDLDPEALRRDVFSRAAQKRKCLVSGEHFDRGAVIVEVARERGVEPSMLESAIYADLRGASILRSVEPLSASVLVDIYERSQAQAILLRAERIRVGVRCTTAAAARALFRRLKFLGLLHTIHSKPDGYDICIDGPLSLFESVTKYGQKMALVLPVLEECEAWTLEADIRWGKQRTPLLFRSAGGSGAAVLDEPPLSDAIATLVRAFSALGTRWQVSPSKIVLDLPGTGLCVPDLVFSSGNDRIYFEALGFWSREAVFRRVTLVERGLSEKILFAVSSRLRVSEEVLGDEASGALYVYKGAMSARAVADHLDRLSAPRA